MSSFGTAKKDTTNLNLGFPDPFAYWYAGTQRPEQYMPEGGARQLNIIAGDDFQAQYHQQKMRDAHYMAGAKVRATHTANARAFSSPNGYYNLPPPVLGQRRFANMSVGALSSSSARQDVPGLAPWSEVANVNPYSSQFQRKPAMDWSYDGAGLQGGVLRTTVGQEWGKAKLNDRINQFNAIAQAKQMFFDTPDGGMGMPSTSPAFSGATPSMSDQLSLLPQVELAQLLGSVVDVLNNPGKNWENVSRFVVSDANKIFALSVRLATTNSAEDIMNALEFIQGNSSGDGITQLLADGIETIKENGMGNEPDPQQELAPRLLQSLFELFERIQSYLKQMLKVADQPANERLAVSKNLIKSLGFLKFMKDEAQLYAQVGEANRETLAFVNPDRSFGERMPIQKSGAFIAPYGNEERPTNILPRTVGRNMAPVRNPYDTFSRVGQRREDTQHGYTGDGGEAFDIDTRQAYGRNASAPPGFYPSAEGDQYRPGGRGMAYLGESVANSGMMEGNDGEVAQFAQLAEEDSSPAGMRSVADPLVGHDIAVGAPAPPRSVAPSVASNDGKFSRAEVPRTMDDLINFVGFLNANVPGYNQKVYNKPGVKASNVFRNTIRKMEQAGILRD